MDDRERLRTTFDQAAKLYQDARPDHPSELFDRLFEVAGLHADDCVVEVGAGPGKATLPLVQRGLHVIAVEPGPALARQARRNLAGYLLCTFSGHIAMAPADREHLFTEIRQRVARRPAGTVRRGWGTVLHLARKR